MASAGPSPTDPNLGRRERRKLEVRTRIVRAARELFDEQGIHGTLMFPTLASLL